MVSEGVLVALIGGSVTTILGVVGIITLRMTMRSNKELAIIAAQNSKDLALISLGQTDLSGRVDGYHKEVDGKMSLLLETTGAAKKAEGKLEGNIEGNEAGRKANQAETDAGNAGNTGNKGVQKVEIVEQSKPLDVNIGKEDQGVMPVKIVDQVGKAIDVKVQEPSIKDEPK